MAWNDAQIGTVGTRLYWLEQYLQEYRTALRRLKRYDDATYLKDAARALAHYEKEYRLLDVEDRVKFHSPASLKSKMPANDDRRSRLHRTLDCVMDSARARDAQVEFEDGEKVYIRPDYSKKGVGRIISMLSTSGIYSVKIQGEGTKSLWSSDLSRTPFATSKQRAKDAVEMPKARCPVCGKTVRLYKSGSGFAITNHDNDKGEWCDGANKQIARGRDAEPSTRALNRRTLTLNNDLEDQLNSYVLKAHESYKNMGVADLKAIYKRSHKVADLNGVPKRDLIADILEGEFGRKRVAAAFAKK